jgi:hypothetical protein
MLFYTIHANLSIAFSSTMFCVEPENYRKLMFPIFLERLSSGQPEEKPNGPPQGASPFLGFDSTMESKQESNWLRVCKTVLFN